MAEEEGKEMSFLEHLEELRWRLVRGIGAILVFAIAAFVAKEFVFDQVILAPKDSTFPTYRFFCWVSDVLGMGDKLCLEEAKFNLQNITMSGQFSMHILVSVVVGIILAFPVLIYQVWSFVRPGLKETERKTARGTVFFSSLLFFAGVLFGYYLIAPLSVQFLGGYRVSSLVENKITLGSFISTITSVTLATGLFFELPILIYFLAKLGLVNSLLLKKLRKHALVVVLLLAAIITPPDITSQVLVSIPIMLLYEASIMIAKSVERKQKSNE